MTGFVVSKKLQRKVKWHSIRLVVFNKTVVQQLLLLLIIIIIIIISFLGSEMRQRAPLRATS